MKTLKEVERRLAELGHHNRYLGRAEVYELPHILSDNEEMLAVATGYYQNGFALLVATTYRLLLIDKKPFFLNMEDTRYDMISEVDFSNHLLDAAVSIRTINKTMVFKSIRQRKLRQITNFIQQKVMELRQHQQYMDTQAQPAVDGMQYEQLPQTAMVTATQVSQPSIQADPAQYIQPDQAAQAGTETQPAADLGAMALNQPQTGVRRFSPYPAAPLTIRRRVSRFYPNTYPRY